jgi:hypothetical protein
MVPRFPVSKPNPHGRVKGSNAHPRPANFGGPSSDVWVNFWVGGYDIVYIKECIDRTRQLTNGINVFRTIGSTMAVTDGYTGRSTYLARQAEVASYCQSVGVRYYPCAGDLTHRGTATDSAVIDEVVALYQAMISYGDTIFGFDMFNEYRNDPSGLSHAATMVANTAAAIRNTGTVSIPYTASINADITNESLIRDIYKNISYFDFHIYETLPFLQANPNLFDFLRRVAPGFKIVVGETGVDRTNGGLTAQQRADYYTAVLTIQNNTTQMLGTCQWAAIDENYGLFDFTTRTLQTDIAGVWQTFPNN